MNPLYIGIFGAVVTGIFIGTQATLSGRIGEMIGPVPTGLFMNLMGGAIAGVLLLILRVSQGAEAWQVPGRALSMLILGGALGVVIIMGVSFSIQRTGVTAGIAALILGQLLVSTIVDATGWGGAEPIPLSGQRILGLVVMAFAVYLLLPRK